MSNKIEHKTLPESSYACVNETKSFSNSFSFMINELYNKIMPHMNGLKKKYIKAVHAKM